MDFSAALLQYLAGVSLRALPTGAAAWALLAALRIRSAATRHAVWTVVAGGMLISTAVSPALPPLPVRILPPVERPVALIPSAPILSPASAAPSAASRTAISASRPWPWQWLAAGIYVAGLLILSVRLAFSYWFPRRLLRGSRPL